MKLADYTCPNCGNTEKDIDIDNEKEVNCKICNTIMKRTFSGLAFKVAKGTKYPEKMKGRTNERARFINK